MKMEKERDLNFEINNSIDLTKMVTGLIMDIRRGKVDLDTAKTITLAVDKLNKHNVNVLQYKALMKSKEKVAFFEEDK